MTKEKLRRLIELAGRGVEQTSVPAWESRRTEYHALMAEFEAWEPEVCGFDARHWMNLAQQYAEQCMTILRQVSPETTYHVEVDPQNPVWGKR